MRNRGEWTPPWGKLTGSGAEEVSRKTVLGLAEVCRPEVAGCAKSMWLGGDPLLRGGGAI